MDKRHWLEYSKVPNQPKSWIRCDSRWTINHNPRATKKELRWSATLFPTRQIFYASTESKLFLVIGTDDFICACSPARILAREIEQARKEEK